MTSEGGTNAPPTATSQDVTTAEDTSKVITLSGTDGDGDELAFDVVADPEHGTLTGSDANRTYTPDPDFHGSDSFTFVADDGLAQSQPATVTITVTPVNDAPIVTAPVTASSVEGSPVPVAAVVADVDGDTPTVTWVVTPTPSVDAGAACGITPQAAATSITCNDDGTFTAVATADDGHGGSATASVAVTVTNANPAITITIAPSLPAPPGASVDVAAVVTDPGSNDTHLCAIDWGDGTVSAGLPTTPSCGASHAYVSKGVKHVVVSTMDDDGGTASASTTITVLDRSPSATAAALATPEDTAVGITLAGTDPDGDPLTFLVTGIPSHGVLTGSGASRVYTPAADFNGTDSFTFTVSDGASTSAPATVTITVTPVNDPPVANPPPTVTALSGSPTPVTLAGSDVDGDSLTVVVITPPVHGNLTGIETAYSYTSTAGYAGPDSFTFAVSDGQVQSPPVTVAIDVTSPPGAPQLLLATTPTGYPACAASAAPTSRAERARSSSSTRRR